MDLFKRNPTSAAQNISRQTHQVGDASSSMNFEKFFADKIADLKAEGRYRTFADLERQVGAVEAAEAPRFAFVGALSTAIRIVAERRQGTLKRLALAPISRAEILIGKLIPCLCVSFFQGAFLLIAGRTEIELSEASLAPLLCPSGTS